MIGAGTAALIGAGLSAAASVAGTAMNNAAKKRESELAWRREQASIREQNQYNSPSAQVARMQAAGLNPNLMYEQGEQGLQTEHASYQPTDFNSPVEPLGNVGQQAINSMIGLKDLQNKTKVAESQVLLNTSTIGLNASQIQVNEGTLDIMYQQLGLDKQKLEGELRQIQSNIDYNEARAKEIAQRINESLSRMEVNKTEISKMSTEQLIMMALLPYQQNEMAGAAEASASAALKAYEEMRYIGAYYHLEDAKFDLNTQRFEWDKTQFYSEQDFRAAQNHLDRRQQYWNMGVSNAVQVLGICVSPAAATIGQMFSRNPWTGLYGQGTATHGQVFNSPKRVSSPVKPYTPNKRK